MATKSEIKLTNKHGLFVVPVDRLNELLSSLEYWSDDRIKVHAAGSCGFPESELETVYADDSRLEVIIMWCESGNWIAKESPF